MKHLNSHTEVIARRYFGSSLYLTAIDRYDYIVAIPLASDLHPAIAAELWKNAPADERYFIFEIGRRSRFDTYLLVADTFRPSTNTHGTWYRCWLKLREAGGLEFVFDNPDAVAIRSCT